MEFEVSVSASICLENEDKELLLVQQKVTLAWGLPAGRMAPRETPAQTATRELEEESGINSNELKTMRLLEAITVIRSNFKTSVGFVYYGQVRSGLELKPNDPDNDVVQAEFFTNQEVELMINTPTSQIHHPEFSVPALRKWLETK